MDARIARLAVIAAAVCALGASHRTPNFLVTAQTQELAVEVAESAEAFRRDLAIAWLGSELPQWRQPCPITVQVAPHLGAGGATSFVFHHGEVYDWRMNIQGPHDRLLDSVLPHEVTHTIFATHFRQPLPRWADEGACTTVEHASERAKQQKFLIEFLKTGRGIAFSDLFVMSEYPADVMPLYSQGYSLARYLIEQGGRQKFVAYIGDGLATRNWKATTERHYGFRNLAMLQDSWLDWVRAGSPPLAPPSEPVLQAAEPVQLAAAASPSRAVPEAWVYRGQTPSRLASALNRLNPLKRKAAPRLEDPFAAVAPRGDAPAHSAGDPAAGRDPLAGHNGWPQAAAAGNAYQPGQAITSSHEPNAYGMAASHAQSLAASPYEAAGAGPQRAYPDRSNAPAAAAGPAPNEQRFADRSPPRPGPDDGGWRPSNRQIAAGSPQPSGPSAQMLAAVPAGGKGVPARAASTQALPGPRQVLLEWSRHDAAAADPDAMAQNPRQGQSRAVYYDAPTSAVEVYRR